jgi:hypothetical protein
MYRLLWYFVHHFIEQRSFNRVQSHRTVWCGQEDSNFHGLSPTTTSTLRVYQFRHGRMPVTSRSAPLAKGSPPRNGFHAETVAAVYVTNWGSLCPDVRLFGGIGEMAKILSHLVLMLNLKARLSMFGDLIFIRLDPCRSTT